MARAIEFDENGQWVLTDGIAFGPPPGQLQLANLEQGDILVWYSSSQSRLSSLIREMSGGPYSHAGIYTDKACSVDAGLGGVAETPIVIDPDEYVQVMRLSNLSVPDQQKVVAAARTFVGNRYAHLDAIALSLRRRAYWQKMYVNRRIRDWFTGRAWLSLLGSCLIWLRRRHPPCKKTFCSQLIVEAYAKIGYFQPELAEAGVFTPNDLAVNAIFEHQGWLCNNNNPNWHPLDPYSPFPVGKRKWQFDLRRILQGTSTGGK